MMGVKGATKGACGEITQFIVLKPFFFTLYPRISHPLAHTLTHPQGVKIGVKNDH